MRQLLDVRLQGFDGRVRVLNNHSTFLCFRVQSGFCMFWPHCPASFSYAHLINPLSFTGLFLPCLQPSASDQTPHNNHVSILYGFACIVYSTCLTVLLLFLKVEFHSCTFSKRSSNISNIVKNDKSSQGKLSIVCLCV